MRINQDNYITCAVISISNETKVAFAVVTSGTRINTAGIFVAFMLMCITQIDRKTGGVRSIHLEAQFTITGVRSFQIDAPKQNRYRMLWNMVEKTLERFSLKYSIYLPCSRVQ